VPEANLLAPPSQILIDRHAPTVERRPTAVKVKPGAEGSRAADVS
jgi:hypothetical protein